MSTQVRRGAGIAFLGAGLLAASCGVDGGNAPLAVNADASTSTASAETLGESGAAAIRIAELRRRFRLQVRAAEDEAPGLPRVAKRAAPTTRATIGASVATRFEATAGTDAAAHVRAVLPSEALRGVSRPAGVELPMRASGEVTIEDVTSHLSVRFALEHVQGARVEVADGMALYRGALDGADVVHRVHAEGTEDFVVFETPPVRSELRYSVDVSRVSGLRLVSNTLEFLDDTGTPLLRVAPPYVVDARGSRHKAKLAVSGCAYDTSPAGPWGRTVTKPGAARCTVRVAWGGDITYPAMVDPAWGATGSMIEGRGQHTASALLSGKALVAGGQGASGTLASAELFDPAGNAGAGTFAATGPMITARDNHTASVLLTGKVLVAGGQGLAELYDPGLGTFVATGPMVAARKFHMASVLLTGKVLVAGGMDDSSGVGLAGAEIFDPGGNAGAGTFAATGDMTIDRVYATASVLLTGKVLVAGGRSVVGGFLASAELFDPAGNWGAGTFAATGDMTTSRQFHTASPLALGKVLVAGGWNGPSAQIAGAELFDPAGNAGAGTFTVTGPMANARARHTASVLPSGKVLVAGGRITAMGPNNFASAELFDPAGNLGVGTFSAIGSMAIARAFHTATVLLSGKVLVAGGFTTSAGASLVASAEVYGGIAGDACATNAYCLSGFCADGFCCNSACSGGGCDRCDLAGTVGTCTLAPSGNAGANAACAFPLACDGVSAVCPTSCATDAACAGSYYCAPNGTCQPRKAQASACNALADCKDPAGCRECTSGFCVDGLCCAAACNGLCQACAAALKQSGVADGVCGAAKDGTNPHNSACATSAQATCGADGQCDGLGACRLYYATGTSCGGPVCAGTVVMGKVCNGSGTCAASVAGVSCDPFLCANGGCTTSCVTTNDCATDGWCNGGVCAKKLGNGKECSTTDACTSGHCADGVCCDKACTGQCEACDSFAGTCGPIGGKPHGSRPACPPGNECSAKSSTCEVPATSATCDGDHTTTGADGTKLDCAPYKCDSNGTCRSTCSSVNECVAPTICDADGKCVPPPADTENGGGCAVAATRAGDAGGSTGLAWIAALVGFMVARRRRAAWKAPRGTGHRPPAGPLRPPRPRSRSHATSRGWGRSVKPPAGSQRSSRSARLPAPWTLHSRGSTPRSEHAPCWQIQDRRRAQSRRVAERPSSLGPPHPRGDQGRACERHPAGTRTRRRDAAASSGRARGPRCPVEARVRARRRCGRARRPPPARGGRAAEGDPARRARPRETPRRRGQSSRFDRQCSPHRDLVEGAYLHLDSSARWPSALRAAKKVLHLVVRFEWDAKKADGNRQKHGVTFEEAVSVFADPLTLISADRLHADRFSILGMSARSRVLFVVYVEKQHGETIRIISARRATNAERQAYEEEDR